MPIQKKCPLWITSNVKERIRLQQIKIETLAIALQLSKSAVSKILNGQNQTIINYLPKLATLLDCSIEDLLQENATEERISKNITPLALSSATAAHKKIVPNTTDEASLKDKLLTHLEMQYAKAQDDIKYWQAKYYRMKDRFTALEAKHPKKPSK